MLYERLSILGVEECSQPQEKRCCHTGEDELAAIERVSSTPGVMLVEEQEQRGRVDDRIQPV